MKRTHLPLLAPASTSAKILSMYSVMRKSARRILTLSLECALQLDTPLSLGTVHLEHSHAHDEDHNAGNQLKDTYGQANSALVRQRLV